MFVKRELNDNQLKIVGLTAIAFLAVAFAFMAPTFIYNIDIALFERYGLEILVGNGTNKELFNWCYERGFADIWINHEQLSSVMMYLLNKIMPYGYPIFSLVVIVGLTMYNYLKNRTKINIATLVVCLILFKMNFSIGLARPATMSTICFMLLMIVLNNKKLKEIDRICLLVGIAVLWGFSHGGSYPLAILVVALYSLNKIITGLSQRSRVLDVNAALDDTYELFTIVGVTIIGSLNTTFRESISYNFLQHSNTKYITEWAPMYKGHWDLLLLTMVVVAYFIYKYRKGKLKVNVYNLVILGGLFVESIQHVRYTQYFAIAMIILIPQMMEEDNKLKRWHGALIVISSIVALVASIHYYGERVVSNEIDMYKIAGNIDINKDLDSVLKEIEREDGELVIAHTSLLEQWLITRGYKVMMDGRVDNLHPDIYEFTHQLFSRDIEWTSEETLKQIKKYGINVIVVPTRAPIVDMAINDWDNVEIRSTGAKETSLSVIHIKKQE